MTYDHSFDLEFIPDLRNKYPLPPCLLPGTRSCACDYIEFRKFPHGGLKRQRSLTNRLICTRTLHAESRILLFFLKLVREPAQLGQPQISIQARSGHSYSYIGPGNGAYLPGTFSFNSSIATSETLK